MMAGAVNAVLEPRLHLTVNGPSKQTRIESVVDTGFNGFLTLPPAVVAALRLPWLCRQHGQLADGSVHSFDVHVATVIWDGTPRRVEVEAVKAQPLVGMELMNGCELRIQVVVGGAVTITSLP